MTRVLRIDDRLRQLDKPSLQKVEVPFLSEGDMFILCAGFEDRAMEALRRAVSAGERGFEVLIIQYKPLHPGNKFEEMKAFCEQTNIGFSVVQYDRENPANMGFVIIEKCRERKNIVIDVSAMSRLLITQLVIAILDEQVLANKSTIIYTEAMQYPPEEKEVRAELLKQSADSVYRTMFISAGVFDVHIIPELSSIAVQGQPVRLIAFPSFNTDQLSALRGGLQPAFFSFLHGVPPLEENRWRVDAIKKLNHTEEIPQREDRNVSTLYYDETLTCLLDIYGQHSVMERLILSPTGSKMQAVAAGIFRAFMKDVQVAYPSPRTFAPPSDYTVGVRAIYSLSLAAFGNLIQ